MGPQDLANPPRGSKRDLTRLPRPLRPTSLKPVRRSVALPEDVHNLDNLFRLRPLLVPRIPVLVGAIVLTIVDLDDIRYAIAHKGWIWESVRIGKRENSKGLDPLPNSFPSGIRFHFANLRSSLHLAESIRESISRLEARPSVAVTSDEKSLERRPADDPQANLQRTIWDVHLPQRCPSNLLRKGVDGLKKDWLPSRIWDLESLGYLSRR